jgi:hypothetical protein
MDPKINSLAKRFLDATVNQSWGLDSEEVLEILREVHSKDENHYDQETYHRFKDEFKQAIYNRLELTKHKDLLVKGRDSIINAILLEKGDVSFFKKARYTLENDYNSYVENMDKGFYSVLSFLGFDRFIYDREGLLKE